MKKIFFLAFTLTLSVSVFSQDKMLSSKQLMSYNLYPQSPMRALQFVGKGNQIAYIQDTVLYTGQPGKAKPCITLFSAQQGIAGFWQGVVALYS